MRDRWNDRDADTVVAFAGTDRSVEVEAMKMWIGLDDTFEVNDDHVLQAYRALDTDTQAQIIEDYVECVGLKFEYGQWYEETFGREPEPEFLEVRLEDPLEDW